MVPKTFSHKEEGDFKKWNFGNVGPDVLARWHPDYDCVYVQGVQVFAFCFVDEHNHTKIWNCKTGWQTKGML